MKKIIYSLLVIFIFITACTQDNETDELMMKIELSKDNSNKKITICHKDKETISISVNALQAHLDHGDKIGPCGYTYVPDDNFENALAAFDDIPNDNLVPTENISGIPELIISGKFIQDLTGIEDFTSLKILNVSFNELTWIDVSNNLNLISLTINNNLLTEIDVSNMLELVNFIAYRNLLTNIILTNTPKLKKFSCSNNSVINLDLSQNTNLTHMWLHNNELESLNVKNDNYMNVVLFSATGNSLLSCVQVDDAAYSTANWTRVDSGTSFSEDCGY